MGNEARNGPWDPFGAVPGARRWIWAALAVWLGLFQGPTFVRSLRPDVDHGVDFFQDWASARFLFDGLPVYSNLREAIVRYLGAGPQEGIGGDVQMIVEVNAHPPTSVLLAASVAWLDYPDATLAWNLFSLLLVPPSLWLVARQLDIKLSAWSIFPIVVLLLLCNPFRQQVNLGQFNCVLMMLITGAWAADRSGRWRLAGTLLGTAAAIKLFPAFLFLYFAVRRQWKTLAAGGVALAVIMALTAAVLGSETFRTYFYVLPRVERSQSGWGNVSLIGFWRKLFDPATALERVEPLWRSPLLFRVGAGLSLVAVIAAVAFVAWQARTRRECDYAFGLAVTGMLLLSPVSWNHYFPILLVPLALVWLGLPTTWSLRIFFLLVLAGLWLDPLILSDAFIPGGHKTGVSTAGQTLAILSFQCYALIGLGALIFLEFRACQRDAAPEACASAQGQLPAH